MLVRAVTYLSQVVRFALLGQLPTSPDEVSVWALTVPLRLWKKVIRFDGRTFEDMYAARIGKVGRALLPLRSLYLGFLLIWPVVAAWRALLRAEGAPLYWRGALTRPEMAQLHPESTYTEAEWFHSRPDYAFSMLYAVLHADHQPAFLRLDDKLVFMEKASAAGLPLPETLTREQAMARGGEFIVKEPRKDLGFGIALMEAHELVELEHPEEVIIQPKMRNHPVLREVYPPDAPLSTLRVITTLDPDSGAPTVSRCAVRMGRDGAIADNTMQGGVWSNIDPATGRLTPGVTKKTFAVLHGGEPIRYDTHPDAERPFAGVKVPWWEEGRELALRAHRTIAPEAPSLGWDIAVAEGAPVFLEVNVWTVCYDYDPPDDAYTPGCRLILQRLRALRREPTPAAR